MHGSAFLHLPCLLLFILGACTPDRPPISIERETIENIDFLAAADLDGDGKPERITVSNGQLNWPGGQVEVTGSLQRFAIGERDGKESLFLATGTGKDARTDTVQVFRVNEQGASTLWSAAVERAQITDMRFVNGALWVAHFTDSRNVAGGWLVDGTLTPETEQHMGMQQLPTGSPEQPGPVVVGRLYGVAQKSPGDLRLVGTEETPLPSLRGVRALNIADLDGDGALDLLVGDGWHHAYGTRAVPRLQLLPGPDWQEGRTIGFLDGDYAVEHILPVPLRQGQALVVVGARSVHLLVPDRLGWRDLVLGDIPERGFVTTERKDDVLNVLFSGAPSQVVHIYGLNL